MGQKQVYLYSPAGIEGMKATLDTDVSYLAVTPIAYGEPTVGQFVFFGPDHETTVLSSTIAAGTATATIIATPTGGGNPINGTLTLTSTGTTTSGNFTPGSFTATTNTATSLVGDISFTLNAFENGTISVGGTTVITVTDGTPALGSTTTFNTSLGVVTVSAPTYAAGAIGFTLSLAVTVATDANAIAGFLELVYNYYDPNILSPGTLKLRPGHGVMVATRGKFWARSNTNVTAGQKVFVAETGNQIATGAAGSAPAGYIETNDWFAASNADAGNLFILQRS